MKIKFILTALLASFGVSAQVQVQAQTLEKMQWFNEPEEYRIKGGVLEMEVPAQCDYWRISHYGFTVDDGPFLYATYGGEFEAKIGTLANFRGIM